MGFRINNPHQVVGHGPKTPLKSPLVQGGTLFSSNVATQRGMRGSLESGNWKAEPLSQRRSHSDSRLKQPVAARRAAPTF